MVFALLDGTPGIGVPGMDPRFAWYSLLAGATGAVLILPDGKGALLKRCIRNIVPGDDGVVF